MIGCCFQEELNENPITNFFKIVKNSRIDDFTYKVSVMNLCKIVDYWMKESDRHRSGVRQGIARP